MHDIYIRVLLVKRRFKGNEITPDYNFFFFLLNFFFFILLLLLVSPSYFNSYALVWACRVFVVVVDDPIISKLVDRYINAFGSENLTTSASIFALARVQLLKNFLKPHHMLMTNVRLRGWIIERMFRTEKVISATWLSI